MKKLYSYSILSIITTLTYTFTYSQCNPGQAELFITSSGGSFPTEKWMSITTDSAGAGTVLWDQGSGVYGASPGLLTNQSVCVTKGVDYFINAYDSFDDGWDGTTYELTDASATVVANNGGVSPDDGTDQDAGGTFGDTQAQELESSERFSYCEPGDSEYFITSSGGSFPGEKWMSITTDSAGAGTVLWAQGEGVYGASPGLLTDHKVCISGGIDFFINAYDSYDDGWDGTTYELKDDVGALVANNGGISPDDGTDQDASSAFGDTQAQELESSEKVTNASPLTYVPDGNFEAYLEMNGMGDGTSGNDYVTTDSINTITHLDLSGMGLNIVDLTGIEDFASLYHLNVDGNSLTTLDMSNNPDLFGLHCDYNNLTSLNVSSNTLLDHLHCQANQLTNLDVTQNTDLALLDCATNQLTSLDVTQNTLLYGLYCTNNQLTSLDVTQNTALTNLYFDINQITSLDVTLNTNLTSVDCDSNQLTSLDLSQNTLLTNLDCDNNQLTSLSVKNGNNTNLALYAVNNSLSCIDVDNPTWATANWTDFWSNIDSGVGFSTDCSTWVGIEESFSKPKTLVRIIDLLGREVKFTPNTPLIYQYDDGSAEKIMREYQ